MKAKDKGGKSPTQMPRAPPMTFEAPEEPDDEYGDDEEDDDEVRSGMRDALRRAIIDPTNIRGGFSLPLPTRA
jgi:hypothetical protein